MHDLLVPDTAILEEWLQESGLDTYQCDHCSGLHFSLLRSQDGVVDSRLFIEPYGILFSTELDLRNMALLPVMADTARLNMSYPTLKLFADVVDDGAPTLVASDTLLTGQGVTLSQFIEFITTTSESVRELLNECHQLQYLFVEDNVRQFQEAEADNHSLH